MNQATAKTHQKTGAIVTGASSGIGLAITNMLLQEGYQVYGLARHFEKNNIENPLFHPICCDITKTSQLVPIIKEIQKEAAIKILINNAGVGYFGLHEELNPQKIHELVATNLEAPMLLAQLLLRTLKVQHGYIINISSVTAQKSSPHGCAYGATKAGLTAFTRSLFDEARKYGVKAITIQPDMTKTNFYQYADFKEGSSEASYIYAEEVAASVQWVLHQRENLVVTELTLQPQKHQLQKQNSPKDAVKNGKS